MTFHSDTFEYDMTCPSGLRWKIGRAGVKNHPAGSRGNSGHFEVLYQGRLARVHRIIYEMFYGEIPEGYVVDHINGNSSDNRIENLRAVPTIVNSRNRKMSIKNTTGVTGVYPFSQKGRVIGYRAQWQRLEGGRKYSKLFTFSKHGDEAFEAAVWWRSVMIDFLNADGAGYTEDHGLRV